MSLFIALLIGNIVGIIGGFAVRDEFDTLLLNLLSGIVGSLLGLGVYFLFLSNFANDGLINGRAMVCSLLGAVMAVGLFDLAQKLTGDSVVDK